MEKTFNCKRCGVEFDSQLYSKAHILSLYKEGYHAKKKNTQCNLCGLQVDSESRLINHMRTHTGERPYKCTECDMTFKLGASLKLHIKRKDCVMRPFGCERTSCLYRAKTFEDLLAHNKKHRGYQPPPNACPIAGCSFRAKWTGQITCHVSSVHNKVTSFACSECDYKTSRSDAMKSHIMRRHSTRKESHSGKNLPGPKLKCSYNTKTNKPSQLARRVLVQSRRIAKISCSIQGCSYKGKNSTALAVHLRRHKSLLACPVTSCGQYVTTKGALKHHVKLHSSQGRPYQCALCFKHFRTMSDLQKHCFTHTNEKPFQCGHCELATSFRARLQSHISLMHPNIKFPFIVFPFKYRQCLHCKVTLPIAEFLIHYMSHAVPIVMIERLQVK